MATHTVETKLATAAEQVPAAVADGRLTITGDAQHRMAPSIPGASTNLEVIVAVDVSALKSLFLFCSRDVTIKTNSSGSPDNTINLRAGEPLHWHTNAYFANPLLAADVTSIFVTLAAGDAATLYWDDLQDPTP
jgi:hypothetical protein